MPIALVRYDAARKALAAAHKVDEVKRIHDKATALLAYAKQAGDLTLQNQAAEIRILAERRAGQLLVEMNDTGQRQAKRNGRPKKVSSPTTLPKLGISRDQSSKWQRLALQISDARFEEALDRAKSTFGELTTAGVLRMVQEVVRPKTTRTEYDINEVADDLIRSIEQRHGRLKAAVENKEKLNPTLRRKLITALQYEALAAQKLSDGFRDFDSREGKAHQRIIRERLAQMPEPDIEEKKRLASTLKNATIREISYEDARGLILANEYLGTVHGEFFFGLFFGEYLGGCIAFGSTAGSNTASSVCGSEFRQSVTTLLRGCCCWWAHKHSGSFIVAGACREMAKKGYPVVVAYSDTEAGEQGVIYRACNFLFCGTTGATERFKMPDGRVRDARLVSGYTRDRTGGTLKYRHSRAEQKQMMLEGGVQFFKGVPKLRWVGFFGSKTLKRRLRAALRWSVFPYPKLSEKNKHLVESR